MFQLQWRIQNPFEHLRWSVLIFTLLELLELLDLLYWISIFLNLIFICIYKWFSNDLRISCPEMLCKKGVLRNFAKRTGKYLCQSLFFLIKLQAEAQPEAQVFSCKFCEISKNTFSYKTPPVAASMIWNQSKFQILSSITYEIIKAQREENRKKLHFAQSFIKLY